MLLLVIISTLTVPTVFATEATVVANASSGDCYNVTFETEGDNYSSYCVQKGMTVPEVDTVYNVEENITSTEVITDVQADKVKIFAIKYRNEDLTHFTVNPKTGALGKELDDVTSRQLIIWYLIGQGEEGWFKTNHVNISIIEDINKSYADGLKYPDKGTIPINNTTQFNYTFKYFSSKDGSLQDFIGWFFVESDIPPQNNETNNTTNETPPPKNETEPPINVAPAEIQKTYNKKVPMTNAAGNPLGLLAFAGLGLGLTLRRRRN